MPEIVGKNIFRNKKTANKVPLIFSALQVLMKRQKLRFWTLSTKKQGIVYIFILGKPENKP